MNLPHLLRAQWRDYARYHDSRANLRLHLFAVPLFLLGNIALVAAPAVAAWWWATAGLVAMAVSIALQARGHRAEAVPPAPFTGPGNAVARLLCEQWVTFPRFVLSGGWRRVGGR